MEHELLTEGDFAGFPEESGPRFLALEAKCRRNLNEIISNSNSHDYDALVKLQYMATVAAAAEELGIDGIRYPASQSNPEAELGRFFLDVNRVTTRLRLRASTSGGALSVRLSARTRGLIELQIRKLRNTIEASELSDDRRDALLRKLDELSGEMNQQRVGFGRTMAVLSLLAFNLATAGVTILADSPDALETITTITKLLGQDKQAEEDEIKRLGAPPALKAIEGPKGEAKNEDFGRRPSSRMSDILDDEIPF